MLTEGPTVHGKSTKTGTAELHAQPSRNLRRELQKGGKAGHGFVSLLWLQHAHSTSRVVLCPQERYTEVPTPRTSECDHAWKQGHFADVTISDEVILESSGPLIQLASCLYATTATQRRGDAGRTPREDGAGVVTPTSRGHQGLPRSPRSRREAGIDSPQGFQKGSTLPTP